MFGVFRIGDVYMADQNDCWRIKSHKYDGAIHREWTCAYPIHRSYSRHDEFAPNLMLRIPAHTKVVESDGKEWSSSYDVIACFYERMHYQVMVLRKGHYNEYYCNSCTVAEISRQSRTVSFIDLDLDLIVDKNHGLRVVDQDEFEENSKRYHYPEDLKMHVRADLSELIRQVRQHKGVFSYRFDFSGEEANNT